MGINTEILIYLSIYSFLIILLSFFISRKQTKNDFLISSRDRGWLSLGMSKYATSIGASWLIAYTSYIYMYGFGVFSLVLGYVIAMLILGFYIGPKLSKVSLKNNFLKIGDIVYFKTKSRLSENIANIFSSLVIFMGLLMVVVSGANLISYFGVLSYELALLGILAIVLFYTTFIGYKGVVSTDIFQSIIILIVLGIISFCLFSNANFTEFKELSFDELSFGTIFGFFIFGIFSTFSFIDRYQLIFSGKDEKNIKKGFSFVIPLIISTVILLLIIGYYVRLYSPDLDGSLVFAKAIEIYLPDFLIPIAIVMFFATVMSSVDSYIYGIGSHFNLIKKLDKVDNIKINILIITLFTGLIAYFFRNVIDITIIVSGMSLVLSVAMLYLFYGKDFENSQKSSSRFIFSSILSFIGLVFGFIFIGLEPVVAMIPILLGGIGLLINIKKNNP